MENKKTFDQNELKIITEAVKRSESLIENKVKNLNLLMAGVIIVMFVAIISMLMITAQVVSDAFYFRNTTNKENEQLKIQEEIIRNNVQIQLQIIEKLKAIDQKISQ